MSCVFFQPTCVFYWKNKCSWEKKSLCHIIPPGSQNWAECMVSQFENIMSCRGSGIKIIRLQVFLDCSPNNGECWQFLQVKRKIHAKVCPEQRCDGYWRMRTEDRKWNVNTVFCNKNIYFMWYIILLIRCSTVHHPMYCSVMIHALKHPAA